jgi:hypothetical protein
MRQARRIGWLRLTAFLAFGSLLVHQARYLAGHGSQASEALARDGHAHMSLALLTTLSIGVALSIIALLVAGVARPRDSGTRGPRVGPLTCALLILAAFCAQEFTEGAVLAGHPGGPAAIFGHGGVIVFPLAVVLGFLVSLLLHGLGVTEFRIAGAVARRRVMPVSSPRRGYLDPHVQRHAALGLVFGFACRPPPSLNRPV